MRRVLIVLIAGLLIGGCGGDESTTPLTNVSLTDLVTILPTPVGFDQSADVHSADAAEVQELFAGRAIPAVAEEFKRLGFEEAAVRSWSGPGDASAVVVASRWIDHFTATNVGAGPVDVFAGEKGARAWTPRALPGARGAQRSDRGREARVLAFAVEDISLFVRADGPASDASVVRTLDLLVKRLRDAAGRA